MEEYFDNERFRKLLLAYPAKAISFLYKYYFTSLVNLSQHFTKNRNASEDIVQETLIHVWERHRWLSKHHQRSIQFYLVRVVKNMSITFFKRSMRQQAWQNQILQSTSSVENSIEIKLIAIEDKIWLRNLINDLPRRERECLLLKLDDELSLDEIAAHLKVSRKAVERSLTSANKRLRRIILNS